MSHCIFYFVSFINSHPLRIHPAHTPTHLIGEVLRDGTLFHLDALQVFVIFEAELRRQWYDDRQRPHQANHHFHAATGPRMDVVDTCHRPVAMVKRHSVINNAISSAHTATTYIHVWCIVKQCVACRVELWAIYFRTIHCEPCVCVCVRSDASVAVLLRMIIIIIVLCGGDVVQIYAQCLYICMYKCAGCRFWCWWHMFQTFIFLVRPQPCV